jgi:hypothetical protein
MAQDRDEVQLLVEMVMDILDMRYFLTVQLPLASKGLCFKERYSYASVCIHMTHAN